MWRRDVALVLLSLSAGPLLASGYFLLFDTFARHGLAALELFDWAFVFETVPFLWLIPLTASVVVGIGNAVAGHFIADERIRLPLAAVLGAVMFAWNLNWLAEEAEGGGLNLATLVSLGAAGALAAVIQVAVVDAFGARARGAG